MQLVRKQRTQTRRTGQRPTGPPGPVHACSFGKLPPSVLQLQVIETPSAPPRKYSTRRRSSVCDPRTAPARDECRTLTDHRSAPLGDLSSYRQYWVAHGIESVSQIASVALVAVLSAGIGIWSGLSGPNVADAQVHQAAAVLVVAPSFVVTLSQTSQNLARTLRSRSTKSSTTRS